MEADRDNTDVESVKFAPMVVLGAGVPFIVTDAGGRPWRIDPGSGKAYPVEFVSA